MSAEEPTALAPLVQYFYIGHYGKMLEEAKSLSKEHAVMRDFYMFRSLIASQRYEEAASKTNQQGQRTCIRALNLLAAYMLNPQQHKQHIEETLKEWMNDSTISNDSYVKLIAATIYYEMNEFKEAMKLVYDGQSMESRALYVQLLLRVDRLDLAAEVVGKMNDEDDASAVAQMATAWYAIASSDAEKLQSSLDSLNELIETHGQTVLLLNTQALCFMQQKKFSDAFNTLKTARELALQSHQKVSADTLINSIICMQQMKRQPLVERILTEFKQLYPNHPWLLQQEELAKMFDDAASKFKQ